MNVSPLHVNRRQWLGATLAAAAVGCQPSGQNKPTPAIATTLDKPLRVLVVDSPAISAKIDRYWSARSDAPLELSAAKQTDVLAMKRLAADVVVYPSELLGTLAEANLIAPLTTSFLDSEPLKRRDILNHARTTEVTWGPATFAVSLGSPTFVLYYRTDLLERLKLSVPRTWDDYAQVSTALSDRAKLGDAVSGENWSAVAEPLSAGWAAKVLLARAAASARHRSEHGALFALETMQPQLEQPPFVKALEDLVAAAKHAPVNAAELTPTDTRQLIYAGRCALAWSWPTATAELAETSAAPAIGIAQLPGATEVYNARAKRWEVRESGEVAHVPLLGVAGVLASITSAARVPRAAEAFLAWLSCSDETVEIAPASPNTTAFRERQLDFPQKWCEPPLPAASIAQYVDVLRHTNDQGLALLSPRLPGSHDYLAALDEAVQKALQGDVSPAESLQSATARFQEITTARGLDAQRSAYHRSLGLDV